MSLAARDCLSLNIVARDGEAPVWYPPPAAPAASVQVWWHYEEIETVKDAKFVGMCAPGGQFAWPHNPEIDRNVRVYALALSADGTPTVSRLEDAPQFTLLFNRVTEAPEIGQNTPATTDSVEIGITRFARFARKRRVTVSANADMSGPTTVFLFDSEDYVARELPRYLTLSREAGALTTEEKFDLLTEGGSTLTTEDSLAALPRTIYLTVANSGGTGWTPESNILEVTFAAGDGTGGSAGDFDPTPRDSRNLDIIY